MNLLIRRTAELLRLDSGTSGLTGPEALQLTLSIVSLHLFPFAAASTIGSTMGVDLFGPQAVVARQQAVRHHVRALLASAEGDGQK